jgi:hypothetical protein
MKEGCSYCYLCMDGRRRKEAGVCGRDLRQSQLA